MKNHCICLLIVAFLALSSSIAIGQDRNASKPQYIGVMYYLDTSGSLLALDVFMSEDSAEAFCFGIDAKK